MYFLKLTAHDRNGNVCDESWFAGWLFGGRFPRIVSYMGEAELLETLDVATSASIALQENGTTVSLGYIVEIVEV